MKKAMSLLLVLALALAIFALPAAAKSRDEGIQPCATKCNCGGTFYTSTTWGTWYNLREVQCIHCNFGTDMLQRRTGTKTETCDSCGRGASSQVSQERRVCHGYNS